MTTQQLILRGVLFLAGMYLVLIVGLMLAERSLVYPAPPMRTDNWVAPSQFEEVNFVSEDGTKLHGWFAQHQRPRLHILFCHGNAECVPHVADELYFLNSKFDASVFAFDYRGYGKSEGTPNHLGLVSDAHAAIRWLSERSKISTSDVLPFGRSLGGAVAVEIAVAHRTKGLVLVSTFSRIADVASDKMPIFPFQWIMRNRHDPQTAIRGYQGKLLQFHGTEDTIVPIRFGKSLFEECPSVTKVFCGIEGYGHNDLSLGLFERELRKFAQDL